MLPDRRIEPAIVRIPGGGASDRASRPDYKCYKNRRKQKRNESKRKSYEITKRPQINHTNTHIWWNYDDSVGVTLKEHIPETSSDEDKTVYESLKNLFAPCQVVAFYTDDPDACKVSKGLHIESWKVSDSWGTTLKRLWNYEGPLLQFSNCTKLLNVVWKLRSRPCCVIVICLYLNKRESQADC